MRYMTCSCLNTENSINGNILRNYDNWNDGGNADYYCYMPTRIYFVIIAWYDDCIESMRVLSGSCMRGLAMKRFVEEVGRGYKAIWTFFLRINRVLFTAILYTMLRF